MTVSRIDQAFHEANTWLNALTEKPAVGTQRQAYAVLRAGLHHLRDRVSVDQACHVGGQLPTLIRGIYFEGWKPADTPTRERSVETFLASMRGRLSEHPEIDPEEALVAVVGLLRTQMNGNEVDHLLDELPDAVRARLEGTGATPH